MNKCKNINKNKNTQKIEPHILSIPCAHSQKSQSFCFSQSLCIISNSTIFTFNPVQRCPYFQSGIKDLRSQSERKCQCSYCHQTTSPQISKCFDQGTSTIILCLDQSLQLLKISRRKEAFPYHVSLRYLFLYNLNTFYLGGKKE